MWPYYFQQTRNFMRFLLAEELELTAEMSNNIESVLFFTNTNLKKICNALVFIPPNETQPIVFTSNLI